MLRNKRGSWIWRGVLLGVLLLVGFAALAGYREFAPPSEPRLSYAEFVMKAQKGEVGKNIRVKEEVAYFTDLTDNTRKWASLKWASFTSTAATLADVTLEEWLWMNGYNVKMLRPFERRFE